MFCFQNEKQVTNGVNDQWHSDHICCATITAATDSGGIDVLLTIFWGHLSWSCDLHNPDFAKGSYSQREKDPEWHHSFLTLAVQSRKTLTLLNGEKMSSTSVRAHTCWQNCNTWNLLGANIIAQRCHCVGVCECVYMSGWVITCEFVCMCFCRSEFSVISAGRSVWPVHTCWSFVCGDEHISQHHQREVNNKNCES